MVHSRNVDRMKREKTVIPSETHRRSQKCPTSPNRDDKAQADVNVSTQWWMFPTPLVVITI